MTRLKEILLTEHKVLEDRINDFISGKISAADLKHDTAPFGIYEQKNGLFMIRIRIPGGEITHQGLKELSNIFTRNNVTSLHITTRQDLQLHDIPPRKIMQIVRQCSEHGFPFRGGGGNTFRNIIASHTSNSAENSLFDLYPYVHFLNDYILRHDKSFGLPRKFKIAFIDNNDELLTAQTNDLGYVAALQDGKQGFTVYAAGGLGRESRTAVKLLDFIPEQELLPCTLALLHLFNDHGNRDNRNKARLRFVLNKLGEDEFKKLFNTYFATEKKNKQLPIYPAQPTAAVNYKTFDSTNVFYENYTIWQTLCTASNKQATELASFTFNVPGGNIEATDFAKLIDLLNYIGSDRIRLTQNQDIFVPALHKSALYHLYSNFSDLFDRYHGVFLDNYFTSCIGASVCKIGIIDTPALARKVTLKLKPIIQELDATNKAALLKGLIENVRFSGCHNSCATHQKATLGLQGMKKRINDVSVECCAVFQKGNELLSTKKENQILSLEEIPDFVAATVKSFLQQKTKDPDLTLKHFLMSS